MSEIASEATSARRERSLHGDAGLLVRVWPFVRPYKGLLVASFALLLLTSLCSLTIPYLIKLGIDRHIGLGEFDGFRGLLGLFVLVAIGEVLAKGFQMYLLERVGQGALVDLRMAVFDHLGRLSSRFFDRTPTGRLIGRVTTDVEALQELFSQGVVTILADFLILAATIVILFAMSPELAAITMIVVPVLVILTIQVRTRVRAAYARSVNWRSKLHATLHEYLAGMPLVQLFLRERSARDDYADTNAGLRDAQIDSVWWESVLSASTELLESLTKALILWYGGGLIARALEIDVSSLDEGLTIGTLVAFIMYMSRFFTPLVDLSMKYAVLQNALSAAEKIFALLDEDDVETEPSEPATPPAARGEIEFRNVTFGYDPADPVLHGVDFRIRAGERVAVVGRTGSGKTTLLRLLTRLYDVRDGRVLLDGVDVRDYGLADLRARVGIVPQDVFLFEGTIADNIRVGAPDISEEAAIAAATELHLDQVVARFPTGFHEPVAERGANLSSGEAQLIAFARVLAASPPVLVMDEATSKVDTATEELLGEAVHRLMEGRTSLVIAHRLSTIRDVDRILVLRDGRLVEDGSHEELLARDGVYRELHDRQFWREAEPD